MNARPKVIYPEPDAARVADPALAAKLTRLYSAPWELDERNVITSINPIWWAGLFAAENGIVYDQHEGFFRYDELDGTYQPESHFTIQTDVAFRILRAAREAEIPQLERKRGLTNLRGITEVMRGLTKRQEPFAHRHGMVALKNGCLFLRDDGSVRFEAFHRDILIRSKSSVPYDPKAKCPRFEEAFLGSMLEDPEDRELLVTQLGFMLFGVNPAHRMVILEGDSAAGKTVLSNIIVSLIGEYRCIQLRTEHLDKQFELEAFRGRSLLLGNDVGSTFLNTFGAQTLKGLTSSDLYHPEAKNRLDRRPLRGPFNVLIGTNTKLTYRAQGDAPAWRRRITLFPTVKPEGRKRIPNFEKVLLETEGAGIVNLLVAGAVRGLLQIRETGDIVIHDAHMDRVEKLILRSEPVETFVNRHIVSDPESDVTSQELLDAFGRFCHVRGWPSGTEDDFFKKVGPILTEKFGVSRSRSISRESGGKSREITGWRSVRLQDDGWKATEPGKPGNPF